MIRFTCPWQLRLANAFSLTLAPLAAIGLLRRGRPVLSWLFLAAPAVLYAMSGMLGLF